MINYISTRGDAPQQSFFGAMLTGLAVDGGLYVPDACPQITADEQANMVNQHYLEIAWRVMAPFVGNDIPAVALTKMLQASYRSFDAPDITPLRALGENNWVLELFHGPTLAFKDVALQFLAQCFVRTQQDSGKKTTIIGATSGDTGAAAIAAFRGRADTDIFILHPHGRVSDIQRRQMTTVLDDNVFNIAIDGSFDDCQRLVKDMFADHEMRAVLGLTAVNSINWARILAQVPYYFYAALRVHAQTGEKVSFSVPTGNFGNAYAGYIAQSMGAPIDKIIVATNSNDILHRFLSTGVMQTAPVVHTHSPSMDIQVSSNIERLIFDLYGRDGQAVAKTMAHFRDAGPFRLDAGMMARVKQVFASGHLDDVGTLAVMADTYQKHGMLIDPHTAVGVGVMQGYRAATGHSGPVVTLATAHPAKFPDAVLAATGVNPDLPARFDGIGAWPERLDVLPPDTATVKAAVVTKALAKRGDAG